MKALLVHPVFPPTYWSHSYALKFAGKKALLPPLGLATVAAMLPDDWRLRLVDLNIESLSDRQIRQADVVLLTGMQVQRASLHEVLRRCRNLGVPTVVGGPYATGEPHLLEEADYLFLGEAEEAIRSFCAAFEAGRAPRITRAPDTPDITRTPVPRWDLVRTGAYLHMSLQYSRGCPFTCEFCDIIVMFGRKPRTKTTSQVLAELEAIRRTGFEGSVFFVDDNFIGNRKAVRELLPPVRKWQERNGRPFQFYTEASLNLAEDSPLMAAMSEAGFDSVFVGIESPSPESLAETRKGQNLKGDLGDRVHEILRHGLEVWAGFIVGFDNDGPDIFDMQLELIERAAIPFAMVGVLQALPNTPLAARLKEAGRLRPLPEADQFGRTNFETRMPESMLLNGYRRLLETLYEPRHYFERVFAMMRRRKESPVATSFIRPRHLLWAARAMGCQGVAAPYRREYWRFLRKVGRWNPSRLGEALMLAAAGHHFIEYTRKVVIPRLSAPQAVLRPLRAGALAAAPEPAGPSGS